MGVSQIGLPGAIGTYPARSRDGLERGVVFAERGHHAAAEIDAGISQHINGAAEYVRLVDHWAQRE